MINTSITKFGTICIDYAHKACDTSNLCKPNESVVQMSIMSIDQDASRFRQIVRGQIKRNLRKYMSNGELIGRQGKELVSIPVPQIELPNFRFGNGRGGVGQGPGAGRPRTRKEERRRACGDSW